MSAQITIKLTPRQFDVLREELRVRQDDLMRQVKDNVVTDAKDRHEIRERAAEIGLLLEVLS